MLGLRERRGYSVGHSLVDLGLGRGTLRREKKGTGDLEKGGERERERENEASVYVCDLISDMRGDQSLGQQLFHFIVQHRRLHHE